MGFGADLITYLDANWAAGTGGTEPARYDMYSPAHPTQHTAATDLVVEEMTATADWESANAVYHVWRQRARLEFSCVTRADADKKPVEVSRLCAAKSAATAGLMWTIDEWTTKDAENFFTCEIYVTQVTVS